VSLRPRAARQTAISRQLCKKQWLPLLTDWMLFIVLKHLETVRITYMKHEVAACCGNMWQQWPLYPGCQHILKQIRNTVNPESNKSECLPSDGERYTVSLELVLFDAGQQKHCLVPPGGLFTGSDCGIVWDDIQLKAGNFGFLQQSKCLVPLDAVRACADGRCVSNLVR